MGNHIKSQKVNEQIIWRSVSNGRRYVPIEGVVLSPQVHCIGGTHDFWTLLLINSSPETAFTSKLGPKNPFKKSEGTILGIADNKHCRQSAGSRHVGSLQLGQTLIDTRMGHQSHRPNTPKADQILTGITSICRGLFSEPSKRELDPEIGTGEWEYA